MESKEKKKPIFTDTEDRGDYKRQGWKAGNMGERGENVQTSSCEIDKSWGCHVPHGGHS